MGIRAFFRIALFLVAVVASAQFLLFPNDASQGARASASNAPQVSSTIYLPFVTNAWTCPTNLSWSTQAMILTARWKFGATTGTNGHIYAIGGYNNLLNPPDLNTNEMYDPVANAWTEELPMPTARSGLGVVASTDGRIFAIGGELTAPPSTVFDTVEIYQPSTNTWTTGPTTLPQPRADFGSALGTDGNIYIFGGHTTTHGADKLVYQYNPTTGLWSTRKPLPTARAFNQAVTGQDGKIYVFGGQSGSLPLTTVEEYDPVADSWTTRTSLPVAEYAASAALGPDGRIYVMGGGNGLTTFNNVQVYDPVANAWTTPTSLPTARAGLAAIAAGNGIFAIGGALAPPPLNGGSFANEELTITFGC